MDEYTPVSVSTLDWQISHQDIVSKRRLFLSAQSCDDNEDASALHYLATLGTEAGGYLRINQDGEIARLGTRAEYCDDIRAALLRFAVLDAPRHGLSQLWAPHPALWQTTLEALGFVADTDKQRCVLHLPPDRSQQASGSALIRLEHIDDFRHLSLQLAQNAKRTLAIFSDDLEAWLYDHDDFVTAVMALAQRSRHSEIRILLRETRPILEHGHRLLHACQRSPSKLQIRKLTASNDKLPCFLLADDNGILFRPNSQIVQGIGYTDYRARAKQLQEQFELHWQSASQDADLRRMTV